MKYLFLALVLAACTKDSAYAPTAVPSKPSLVVDLTPPPAPTNVSVVLDSIKQTRAFLTVTWTDNSTFTDEFNTCGWFGTDEVMWSGKGSGCSYANVYDQPSGSTGVRHSSNFVASKGGPWRFTMVTFRRFEIEPDLWYNVGSASSTPVFVCAAKKC